MLCPLPRMESKSLFRVDLTADGNARLAVQDRGPGIPQAD